MARDFNKLLSDPYGPGHDAFAIVPHASDQLQQNGENVVLRALFIGGAGVVTGKVLTGNGAAIEQSYTVVAGTTLNFAFTHINTTSTASLMVGLL